MVDQHYRSSERGKAGMFCLQQVVRFFLFSMTSWLTSDHVINKKHIEHFIGNILAHKIISTCISRYISNK